MSSISSRVGELVVDKGKDEFSPDENLVQQFDEALNQTLDRQDELNLIQDITSSLSYSLDPELDLEFALEICFDNHFKIGRLVDLKPLTGFKKILWVVIQFIRFYRTVSNHS